VFEELDLAKSFLGLGLALVWSAQVLSLLRKDLISASNFLDHRLALLDPPYTNGADNLCRTSHRSTTGVKHMALEINTGVAVGEATWSAAAKE
jgi:hypothetical protein